MSKTADTASPDKGEAAVSEKTPEPKTLEWRGLTLTLPATLPAMRLAATWRRLMKAAQAEDGQATTNYLVDIVDVLLGHDEQLADRVWDQIDSDEDDAEAVFELADRIAGSYGVESGE